MKLGLATSTAIHVGVLGWALIAINAPAALETADVQAISVDIIPIEDVTTVVAGAEQAPKIDAPSPEPVEAPPVEEPGDFVGEAKVDVPVDPAPVIKEVPVDRELANTAPEPNFEALEVTDVPDPRARPERESAPTTEIAEKAEPETPIAPVAEAQPVEVAEVEPTPEPEAAPEETSDPISEAIAAADRAEPEAPREPRFASLPNSGPKALYRPRPAQRATTPDRRKDEAQQRASKAERGERNVADEVAKLLNQERASGGGTRRPDRPASQGGSRTTGAKLTASEMDALRRRIGQCWNPPSGVMNAGELVAKVRMRLDPSGQVIGRPEILSASGGQIGQIAAEAGVRAMRRCAPYSDLPADKYETWSEVVVNFDPREMF